MSESAPTVSVIIPTYNNAHYIAEAIESVLSQALRPLDIIVVDDGSTDDIAGALRPFGDRVTLLHQPNLGAGAARNRGVAASRGELIAFLDADDYWTDPDKLRIQAALLTENADAGLVFHQARMVDAQGRSLNRYIADRIPPGVIRRPVPGRDDCFMLEGDVLLNLMAHSFILLSSVVVTRRWFEKVEGFDAQVRRAEDRDLWYRLLAAGCRCAFADRPWMDYRKFRDEADERLLSLRNVERRVLPQLKLLENPDARDPRVHAAARRTAAWEFKSAGDYRLLRGDYRAAAGYYGRAFGLWKAPGLLLRWSLSRLGGAGRCLLRPLDPPQHWDRLRRAAEWDTHRRLSTHCDAAARVVPPASESGPTVSVIIPVYNNAPFIAAAIESVLSQTLRPCDIIVVDDGSTDDIAGALRPFGDGVKLVRQQNLGAGAARNRGVAESRGELIAFLDADDYWTHPAKLSMQASLLTGNAGAGLSFHPVRLVDGQGGSMDQYIGDRIPPGVARRPVAGRDECFMLEGDVLLCLMEDCFIALPSVVMARQWFDKAGGFDTRLRRAQDRDLWFRLVAAGCPIAFVSNPWADYRKYRDDADERLLSIRHVEGRVLPQLKLLKNPDVRDPRVRAAARRMAAWEFKSAGDYRLLRKDHRAATDYYRRAFRLWKAPGLLARWVLSCLGGLGRSLLQRLESPQRWARLQEVSERDTQNDREATETNA